MKQLILYITVLSALFSSCSSDKNNGEYLPKANGNPGDMVIIMDSLQWNGELGTEVKQIFQAEMTGLPQPEPMFNVYPVHPSKGLTMLTRMRNLVYVFTLDQQTRGSKILRQEISEGTLNKIRTDSSFFLSTNKNEYARGQQVMYLFGKSEEDLMRHLRDNRQRIIDYFNRSERERIAADLLSTRSTQGLTDFLQKEQQIQLHVPAGYRLADKQPDFVWLRSMTAETDKDVFVAWKPYESEYQLLPDSIIAWRNEICKKYLYEDPEEPLSYLVTEQKDAKVQARQMKLNNNFAMELRGLWRTNQRTMGGPFVGYALIDEPRGLLYYIEGFAYAPGKDKREMIRELETILWTFRTSAEIKKESD